MKHRWSGNVMFGLLIAAAGAAHAADTLCPASSPGNGQVQTVMTAIQALQKTLTAEQRTTLEHPLTRESAIRWSSLPVGIVPRAGLRFGDMDAKQNYAARRVAAAALSACGLTVLDDIRIADHLLKAVDESKVGWDGNNYFLAILGTPSPRKPWMLQLGGHHAAYNLTFNGKHEGATPLFVGVEPIAFSASDVQYEPLAMQSAAMSNLARALANHSQAKLTGNFAELVKGVVISDATPPTGGTDTGFPHTYPTGTADRGILYSALSAEDQALVRAAIKAYASLPGEAIARPLVTAYETPAALAETWLAYSGEPDLSAPGSYVRIDGPRVWMELAVQTSAFGRHKLRFHALWRDKLSDYGGVFGK
ncbi:MAG TPA: DUF3500 domain-containing protein [Steroidobacteraceae bacterium]|nr:DUF3500 domain-containing protein [Steroidobacteraceae bacterium]